MDRHISRLFLRVTAVFVFGFATSWFSADARAQDDDLFDFSDDFTADDDAAAEDTDSVEEEWSLDMLDDTAGEEADAEADAAPAEDELDFSDDFTADDDAAEDTDSVEEEWSLDMLDDTAGEEADAEADAAPAEDELDFGTELEAGAEDQVDAAVADVEEAADQQPPAEAAEDEMAEVTDDEPWLADALEAQDTATAEAVVEKANDNDVQDTDEETVAETEEDLNLLLEPLPQELGMNQEVWRQEKLLLGEQEVHQGNKALREDKFQEAVDHYNKAKEIFPLVSKTSPDIQNRLDKIDKLLQNVHVTWAWALVDEAEKDVSMDKFDEAMDKVEKAIQIAPSEKEELAKVYATLKERRKKLEYRAAVSMDTVDPEKEQRSYDIDVLLEQGKLLFENQRYTQAKRVYEDILVKDPYQVEAMRMLRRIGKELQRTAEERRLAIRAERLAESTWTWSQPVRPMMTEEARKLSSVRVPKGASDAPIREKLQEIVIPRIEFEEATIHQVVTFLKTKSKELDPESEGVNIILHLTEGASAKSGGTEQKAQQNAGGFAAQEDFGGFGGDTGGFDDGGFGGDTGGFDDGGFGGDNGGFGGGFGEPAAEEKNGAAGPRTLTLNMDNVPLGEVIKFVCLATNLKRSIEPHAVIISDTEISQEEMITRFFPVGADLFEGGGGGGGGGDDWDLMGGDAEDDGGNAGGDETDVKSYFTNLGVSFPKGATIHYDKRISKLIVRNTEKAIQQIENILEEIDVRRSQVTIEAKFVEVYQDDMEGLGFQWVVQDGLGAGDDPFKIQSQARDYFFSPNINDTGSLTGWEQVLKPFGLQDETYSRSDSTDAAGNPIAGYNITVTESTSPRQLTLLSNGIRTIGQAFSTGTESEALAVTTILGGMELDTIINAISQKSNSDILSAPKVTTTSGNTAIIRMVEERYFPESWTEPELESDEGSVTITPSSPEFGDARDIGVLLEVTPTVENDGYTIGLDLRPQVLEFRGYDTEHNVLTTLDNGAEIEWKFNMPIIAARTVETSVVIYNGETVVLGGMINEKVEEFVDSVPILSDVPLIGRLFENSGERTVKRNLLVFVTARLVDPAGQPLREKESQGIPDFGR